MQIYKFKDVRDGNYAFVLSATLSEAVLKLKTTTNIGFVLETEKPADECGTWIIFNKIKDK